MSIHAIIPLVSLIAYVPLVVLTLRRPKVRLYRVFVFNLLATMLWSFSSFGAHADLAPAHTIIWSKFIMITFTLVAATYYHFVRAFLNKPNGIWVTLCYTFVLVVGLLAGLGVEPVGAVTEASGTLRVEYGIGLYFILSFGLVIAAGSVYSLFARLKHLSDALERRRIIYLLIGIGVISIGALTNMAPSLGMYPLDHFANFINALIIFYAIARYQLLDIRIVIQRGLAYSVVTIGLSSAYLFLLYFMQDALPWSNASSLAAAAGLALLFAIIFQPLRHLIQEGIERLFYGRNYDYRHILLSFNQRMSNVLNLSEVAENMLFPITRALNSKRALLFLAEGDGGDFVCQFEQPPESKSKAVGLRLARDNPIVAWLAKGGRALYRETMDIEPRFKSLWESERVELDRLELALFCPIRRKGNLIGILALGRKARSSPYSEEDIDLISTMSSEAAIVMENALMLDSLKEQQDRVEQLFAKTVLAQEDERKRISVELHDSVAQWLVGASYRMQTCSAMLSEGDNHSEARAEMAEIEDTIDRSLKEIRRVMAGLHPPALDELGLVHSLKQLLEGLKPDGIAYVFEPEGEPVRLPASAELTIYRVVQEALNNVRKHADATAVVLRLKFDRDNVSVEIHDNGRGFNLSKINKRAVAVGHMGLLGMKERATMLRGTLKVKTRLGAGTSIFLTLPLTVLSGVTLSEGEDGGDE